jgi:hypothetical protein
VVSKDGYAVEEVLASHVYASFAKDRVSKAIAAQYLAERLQSNYREGKLTSDELRKRLPVYLTKAIDYVTGTEESKLTVEKVAHE